MIADVGSATVIAVVSATRFPASLDPHVPAATTLPPPVDPTLIRARALPTSRMPDPATALAVPASLNEHESGSDLGDPHLRRRRLFFDLDDHGRARGRRRVDASASPRADRTTRGASDERRYQCKASERLQTHHSSSMSVDESKRETIPERPIFTTLPSLGVKFWNRGFNATPPSMPSDARWSPLFTPRVPLVASAVPDAPASRTLPLALCNGAFQRCDMTRVGPPDESGSRPAGPRSGIRYGSCAPACPCCVSSSPPDACATRRRLYVPTSVPGTS